MPHRHHALHLTSSATVLITYSVNNDFSTPFFKKKYFFMIDLVICAAPDRRKSPGSRLDRRSGEDGTMSCACIKAETAVPCRQLTDLLSLSHGRTMGRRTYEYLSHYGSFHFYIITVKSTFQPLFQKKYFFMIDLVICAAPDRRKSPGSRLDRRSGEDGTMSCACIKAETAVPCRQLTDLLSLSHGRTMGRRTYEYLSHYGSFHFYIITVKSTFQPLFQKKFFF